MFYSRSRFLVETVISPFSSPTLLSASLSASLWIIDLLGLVELAVEELPQSVPVQL